MYKDRNLIKAKRELTGHIKTEVCKFVCAINVKDMSFVAWCFSKLL